MQLSHSFASSLQRKVASSISDSKVNSAVATDETSCGCEVIVATGVASSGSTFVSASSSAGSLSASSTGVSVSPSSTGSVLSSSGVPVSVSSSGSGSESQVRVTSALK